MTWHLRVAMDQQRSEDNFSKPWDSRNPTEVGILSASLVISFIIPQIDG